MEGFWKPLKGSMWYSITSLASLVILLGALDMCKFIINWYLDDLTNANYVVCLILGTWNLDSVYWHKD